MFLTNYFIRKRTKTKRVGRRPEEKERKKEEEKRRNNIPPPPRPPAWTVHVLKNGKCDISFGFQCALYRSTQIKLWAFLWWKNSITASAIAGSAQQHHEATIHTSCARCWANDRMIIFNNASYHPRTVFTYWNEVMLLTELVREFCVVSRWLCHSGVIDHSWLK